MTQHDYLEMFLEESNDHLKTMNEQLFLLEQMPEDKQILAEIFRAAHTLKGMSATMGFDEMASLTHSFENVLDEMRAGKVYANPEQIDLFFDAVGKLEQSVERIRSEGKELTGLNQIKAKIENVINKTGQQGNVTPQSTAYDEHTLVIMEQAIEDGIPVHVVQVTVEQDAMLKGVRAYMVVAEVAQFGELFHSDPVISELEEGLFDQQFTLTMATGLTAEEIIKRLENLSEIERVLVKPFEKNKVQPKSVEKMVKKDEAIQQKNIRVNVEKLDELMYLFEELVIERGRMEQIARQLQDGELTDTTEKVSRTISHLQDVMLSVRMMPLEAVFSRYPRMVRTVSKELGKQIRFTIEGAQTEIDRAIIDEIGDPLLHLLRNSMDHGIETPEVREKRGKDREGTITLRAFYSGSKVVIEIEDDGGGIQRSRVLEKAIANELVTQEASERMKDEDVFQLLFEPGFSTANTVTDLSGRGVGLDVVKTTFSSLGGDINVTSVEGKGSKFSIALPLTVSIMEVMIVKLNKETYAIPIANIVETALIKEEDIHEADGQALIDVRGHLVPLYSLKQFFGLPETETEEEHIVILYRNNDVAAVKVDSFIGHQEVVLKSLGVLLNGTVGVSGATILGDGTISMIVDTSVFFTKNRGATNE